MARKLDELNDVEELWDVMEMLDLSIEDSEGEVRDPGEMISELREYLQGSSTQNVGETHPALSEAGKFDAEKRGQILDLYLRAEQFQYGELKCDETRESIIGVGSFSTVYNGVLVRGGKPEIKVAVKKYKNPLTTQNMWQHFIDEEQALRQLTHPNIVTFYGIDLRHGLQGTSVTIVLELCNCSLRSQVMSQPENAPARLPNEAVKKKVLGWVLNILDALRYIHSEGFVHRDLKLDNILLTRDGRVKIADVGVAKHESDTTSLYLAPEVYQGEIYDSKADMYSFGFVLWELWYGETTFQAEIASKPQSAILGEVMSGRLRPSHIEGTQHPGIIWQHVMTSCWNKEPRSRLTAQKCLECLKRLDDRGTVQPKPPPVPPRTATPPQSRSQRIPPPVKPKPTSRIKKPEGPAPVPS